MAVAFDGTREATQEEHEAFRQQQQSKRKNGHEAPFPGKALPFFTARDVHGDYQPRPYIVKGVLEPGEWLTVYGDSGSLKSFLVFDLAMHVALGLEWCGHRTHQTAALVILGEGSEGSRKRARAWLRRQRIGPADRQPSIAFTTQPAEIMDDPAAIAATIVAAELKLGEPIGIVVFDTLSSCFGDGDESSTADMRRAMSNTRKGCGPRAVIVVHHCGHADKGRERGSYVLRGDADRRVRVEREGDRITATCEKAKDDEPFAPLSFSWHVVELGWRDADGDELTSLALEPAAYQASAKKEPWGKLQREVMRVLREHGAGLKRGDIARALPEHDASNVRRAVRDLIIAEVLCEVAGIVGIRGNERP